VADWQIRLNFEKSAHLKPKTKVCYQYGEDGLSSHYCIKKIQNLWNLFLKEIMLLLWSASITWKSYKNKQAAVCGHRVRRSIKINMLNGEVAEIHFLCLTAIERRSNSRVHSLSGVFHSPDCRSHLSKLSASQWLFSARHSWQWTAARVAWHFLSFGCVRAPLIRARAYTHGPHARHFLIFGDIYDEKLSRSNFTHYRRQLTTCLRCGRSDSPSTAGFHEILHKWI